MSLQALFPDVPEVVPVEGGTLSTRDDFEVLGLALEAASLTDAVSALDDFTLFAPTDDAFGTLAQSLGFEGDVDDPDAVFGAIAGALAGLADDGDPIPLLTDILLYHVAPEEVDLDGLNADGPVDTLLTDATFEVTGGTVVDGDPDFQNAGVVSADVDAGLGSIQVVDQVLLPLDTPAESGDPTLLGVLEESGGSFDEDGTDFDMLLTALQATGLDEAVDDPEADVTVFAPTDSAFVAFAQSLGYEGDDEAGAFQAILDAAAVLNEEDPLAVVSDILAYHVSPGEQDSTAVLGADALATLQGGEIGVEGATLVDMDPDAVDPMIVATDIPASNGTAHVIDAILRPGDIPEDVLDDDDVSVRGSEDDDDDDWIDILGFASLFLVLALVI